jgi:putative phage-type endonuclease
MIIETPEQRTPDWIAARRGLCTGSRVKELFGTKAARTTYMHQLVAERMTDVAAEFFVNDAMKHGTEQEPFAREEYEAKTGEIVSEVGFVLHPTIEFFGASPDGLIGDDGLIEIKCPTTVKYVSWVIDNEIPKEHKPQMIAQLVCTGRKWCDFVAYDPRIKVGPKIWIKRFTPTEKEREEVEEVVSQFLQEVDDLFTKVTEAV